MWSTTFERSYMGYLELAFQAVRLQIVTHQGEAPAGCVGSGFLMRDKGALFLYTTWHLVTGFRRDAKDLPAELPDRHSLRLDMKDAQQSEPGGPVLIRQRQQVVVPLSDAPLGEHRSEPLWHQDEEDIPNLFLNSIGLRIPRYHDIVRLRLPDDVRTTEIQVVDHARSITRHPLQPSERAFVLGYPYGFSAGGDDEPTPIVITRNIASTYFDYGTQFLLDGDAAPGMSGGPVFVDRSGVLNLAGIYTGNIYPEHVLKERKPNPITVLGTATSFAHFDPHTLVPHTPLHKR